MATRKKDDPNPFSFKNFVRQEKDEKIFGSDDDELFPEASAQTIPGARSAASGKRRSLKAKAAAPLDLPFDDVGPLDLTQGSGIDPSNG